MQNYECTPNKFVLDTLFIPITLLIRIGNCLNCTKEIIDFFIKKNGNQTIFHLTKIQISWAINLTKIFNGETSTMNKVDWDDLQI